jgi:peptide-methionine (S)-S-oxide reductase
MSASFTPKLPRKLHPSSSQILIENLGLIQESGMTQQATEIATLGGGCFWCTEAVFQQIRGVLKVESGYAGGAGPNPTYEQICTGKTGHAEVVRLEFDPAVINYKELLEIFFTIHDPTTLNRQGNDAGTQYRSVIHFHDAGQQAIAKDVMSAMVAVWDDPIVTELSAAPVFYIAEAYHQNYFRQHPQQGYCSVVVAPKVAKARKLFASKLIA